MTYEITLVRNERGDDEMHLAGCADVAKTHKRSRDGYKQTYKGETLVDAIVEADTDMADWFCETPYSEGARDNGCWTTKTQKWAPCFASMVKALKVQFDATTGRPFVSDFVKSARLQKAERAGSPRHQKALEREALMAKETKVVESKKRTVKVWMAVSVEIDIDELAQEYGRTFTVAEARQDVKDSILGALTQAIYPQHAIDKIVLSVKETK